MNLAGKLATHGVQFYFGELSGEEAAKGVRVLVNRCVCVRAFVHVCVRVCVHVCVCACACVCVRVRACARERACASAPYRCISFFRNLFLHHV